MNVNNTVSLTISLSQIDNNGKRSYKDYIELTTLLGKKWPVEGLQKLRKLEYWICLSIVTSLFVFCQALPWSKFHIEVILGPSVK